MAKIHKTGGFGALEKISECGDKLITSNLTKIQDSRVLGNIIGTESIEISQDYRDQATDNIKKSIRVALQTAGVTGTEGFTEAQIEAASIVIAAKANPLGYATKALDVSFSGLESYQQDAPMHAVDDYNTDPLVGNEYFNATSLDTHLAASFTFNLVASRQGQFAEAFFPTIVADPTECGMLVEIRKTMIHRAVRHTVHEKDAAPFNRRNILDAATDPTVLEDYSTRFVPYRLEDDSNAKYFVDKALIAPHSEKVGDYSVPTSPLAFHTGQKDLMNLTAHPGLVSSGVLNESDEFDGRVSLQRIIFSVETSAADSKTQLVSVMTDNLAHASFNKSQEGDGRDMVLNFRGAMFGINSASVDLKGQPVLAYKDLVAAGYLAQFTVTLNSNLNLQTGIEEMTCGRVHIASLRTPEGVDISITEGQGKTLVDNIVIEPVGYEYKMTRSNSNRRTKGLLVDNVSTQERYKITLGSPITSRKPITSNVDDSQRLNDVITAARMRNDNLAITKLLSYTETLKEVFESRTDQYEIPTIEGVGRHYVAPWFGEYHFHATEQVASLESKDVTDNLSCALLSVVRAQCVTAYRDARFQPALEMLSGYTVSKPEVLIGTDPFTANWLSTKGDIRTLGSMFDYSIVTTNDIRFRNRIQWVFKVGSENGGFCPLHFGNHLWVPELISNTNLSRTGETANEITVQPRNYHIINTPITGVVYTYELAHYVESKPDVNINPLTTPKNPLYIEGLLPDGTVTPVKQVNGATKTK